MVEDVFERSSSWKELGTSLLPRGRQRIVNRKISSATTLGNSFIDTSQKKKPYTSQESSFDSGNGSEDFLFELSSVHMEGASQNIGIGCQTADETVNTLISPLTGMSLSQEEGAIPMAQHTNSSTDITTIPTETWYFEFPQDLCGRLIGKKGVNVNSVNQQSGASVYVTKAWTHVTLRTIKITGTVSQIRRAVCIIESKFPGLHLRRISNVKFLPVRSEEVSPIKLSQVQLPLGIKTEVIISSIFDAGHFYIQFHSTATQSLLNCLQLDLTACYESKGQVRHIPSLPQPPLKGTYCAARGVEGWFRAQVIDVLGDGSTARIVFVDYGCHTEVPLSSLKQLRADFFKMPFQAVECHIANVVPLTSEVTYSSAATCLFEEFTRGSVLQAVCRSFRNDIPCLDLYIGDCDGKSIHVNESLVRNNLARWSNAIHDDLT